MSGGAFETMRRRPYIVVIPGAGAQFPGMGEALLAASPAASDTVRLLDDACDLPLEHLVRRGTPGELSRVENCYPAAFAVAVAAYHALVELHGPGFRPPSLFAGHSLGHFAALVCAGAVAAHEGLQLVVRRADLMAAEHAARPGDMLSVSGIGAGPLTAVLDGCPPEIGTVVLACRNGPDALVVSGDRSAVRWAGERLGRLDAVRLRPVRAGLAAHSPLMAAVGDPLGKLAADLPVRPPDVPVLSNLTGQPLTEPAAIRAELAPHVTSRIRWDACLRTAVESGVELAVDLGPGRAMTALATDAGLPAVAVNNLKPMRVALAEETRREQ